MSKFDPNKVYEYCYKKKATDKNNFSPKAIEKFTMNDNDCTLSYVWKVQLPKGLASKNSKLSRFFCIFERFFVYSLTLHLYPCIIFLSIIDYSISICLCKYNYLSFYLSIHLSIYLCLYLPVCWRIEVLWIAGKQVLRHTIGYQLRDIIRVKLLSDSVNEG